METADDRNHILTEEKLSAWKKKDLVQWLADRKKKKSGKKQVLIHRIIRALRFDNSSESDCDSSSNSEDEHCNDIPNIESVQKNWQPISTNMCPPTRKEDVENYFVYNKNPLTGKTQGCHRQLKKARKFSKEGYLYDILYNGMDNTLYCYIKAKCKPSMKETVFVDDGKVARHYSLHVLLVKKTGKIEGGHCNCKAGLSGMCSHIGGLLLTLAEIKNACTSRGCEWLKPQSAKKLQPERLRTLQLSANSDAPVRPFPDTYQAGPCKDPAMFLKDIIAGLAKAQPNSVLYRTMNPHISDISDITAKYEPP